MGCRATIILSGIIVVRFRFRIFFQIRGLNAGLPSSMLPQKIYEVTPAVLSSTSAAPREQRNVLGYCPILPVPLRLGLLVHSSKKFLALQVTSHLQMLGAEFRLQSMREPNCHGLFQERKLKATYWIGNWNFPVLDEGLSSSTPRNMQTLCPSSLWALDNCIPV